MIRANDFRMVEVLSYADLEAHPVWADFHDGADRRRVLGWGVSADVLDRELRKYDYCGRSPLYPVLRFEDPDALEALVNPTVALHCSAAGRELGGYRVGEESYVLFHGDGEFCLNPSLPGRWQREAQRLAEALGVESAALFPIGFTERAAIGAAQPRRGAIEQPVAPGSRGA